MEEDARLADQRGDVVRLAGEDRLPGGQRLALAAGAGGQDADPVEAADVAGLELGGAPEGGERRPIVAPAALGLAQPAQGVGAGGGKLERPAVVT